MTMTKRLSFVFLFCLSWDSLRSIKELISSTQTGKSVSFSDFSSDDLVDYRSALEYVNGSMQVNAEKVNELIKAKAQEQIAINKTNKTKDSKSFKFFLNIFCILNFTF